MTNHATSTTAPRYCSCGGPYTWDSEARQSATCDECGDRWTDTSRKRETMAETRETATGWICTDCMMLLANGETPPEMDENETAAWLDSLDDSEMTPGLMADEHDEDCPNHGEWQGEECYCETQDFSWSPCDSCRSHLGGTRHAVTFWL